MDQFLVEKVWDSVFLEMLESLWKLNFILNGIEKLFKLDFMLYLILVLDLFIAINLFQIYFID